VSAGYDDVVVAANALVEATSALEASPSEATLGAARAAWRAASETWQRVELVGVGPAAPPTAAGGQGLRDLIYSWPLVSRCVVDQTIVSEGYGADDFTDKALINARGLAAIEYLLFFDGSDNGCSSTSSINTQGSWAALGEGGVAERRRAYAAVLARDVADTAANIASGWAPEGGDVAGELARAGAESSLFASEQAALNAVTDGLFYVDKQLKDLKLGKPLGLYECVEASCTSAAESQIARVGRVFVRENLAGLERFVVGCDASAGGLDALLRARGAVELADRLVAQIGAARAATDALASDDIVDAVTNDRAKLEALHAAVGTLATTLRTELMAVLDLEPPLYIEGDND
jgi:predicted lipoprotein